MTNLNSNNTNILKCHVDQLTKSRHPIFEVVRYLA